MRSGMGALIPFVVLVLGGLFVFLAASHYASSNAALSTVRTYDLRAAIDAGRVAIAGTIPEIRRFIASNSRYPGASMGWRDLLTPPLARRQKPRPCIIPLSAALRNHFQGIDVDVTDVRVGIAEWFEPSYQGVTSLTALPFQPQGTIGLAVNASVQRNSSRVTRMIVQRWVFSVVPKGGTLTDNIGDDILVKIEPEPQATMILQ